MATKKAAAKKAVVKKPVVKKEAAKKAPAKKAAPKKAAAKKAEPTYEQIAALAEKYFHEHGGHGATAEEDWLRAERELKGI
jgi:hypothetical protein